MEDYVEQYKMEPTCAWCLKRPTGNKTYEKYLERGNICSFCNANFTNAVRMSMTSTEKREIYKQIDEHKSNMNLLAEGLELEITEGEAQMIKYKMSVEYDKIVELRKALW
tara:strand:+ start:159 stop:488 length:330 start_codon:yes stop_codon:yes gene_type:complete